MENLPPINICFSTENNDQFSIANLMAIAFLDNFSDPAPSEETIQRIEELLVNYTHIINNLQQQEQ